MGVVTASVLLGFCRGLRPKRTLSGKPHLTEGHSRLFSGISYHSFPGQLSISAMCVRCELRVEVGSAWALKPLPLVGPETRA